MKNSIDLEDLKTAYSYKSNKEIKFTYFVFCLLQKQKIVKLLQNLGVFLYYFKTKIGNF